MISLHLTIRPREERLLRNELLALKLRCHKLYIIIAQIFQAGSVTECAAAFLSFRYLSFTGKPEQTPSPLKSTRKGTTARWCDIRREILEFFVAQCTLIKSGAVQSG